MVQASTGPAEQARNSSKEVVSAQQHLPRIVACQNIGVALESCVARVPAREWMGPESRVPDVDRSWQLRADLVIGKRPYVTDVGSFAVSGSVCVQGV
jgi:hypothetical protein